MYIERIYHMPSLNRLHRHNQMPVLRLSIPRSDSSHSAEQLYIYLGVYNELREEIEQNRTWRLRDILS